MHQVRNLVLNDAQGAVEGMVLVLLDVTERYSAEERFERTFNANPAPAVICSLADLRYVKVNQGFLEMTGYARQDVLDKTVRELDVLGDTPQREDALQRLAEGRTIPQTESSIAVQGGASKLVVVAGQPIEVAEQPCMLFTFNDLEPRRRDGAAPQRAALRHGVPAGAGADDAEHGGRPTARGQRRLRRHHRLRRRDAVARRGRTGAAVDRSARLRSRHGLAGAGRQRAQPGNGAAHARGALLDCLLSAAPVNIQDLPCVLGAIQDITERKRNELELMEAIETVMQDTSWFSRTVIEKLAQIRAPGAPQSQGELADLTRREREILGLICDGHTDAEIAATLHLSRNTVRNHVAALYGKLDVHRRSAAIICASAASWATRNARAQARAGRLLGRHPSNK